MITLTEQTLGLWWVGRPNGDILMHVARDPATGISTVTSRTRTYVDDKIFEESADKKEWLQHTSREPAEVVVTKVRHVFEVMKMKPGPHEAWELMMEGKTIEQFGKALARMPGMHAEYRTIN